MPVSTSGTSVLSFPESGYYSARIVRHWFLTVTFLVDIGLAKAKIEKDQREHLCRVYT